MEADAGARGWLALSCDRDGAIISVLRDDYGFALAAAAGTKWFEIVDSGSRAKAQKLVSAALERGSIAGWILNVPSNESARPLIFAAAASPECVFILGAPDAQGVTELCDEVSTNQPAIAQALRPLLGQERPGITAAMSRDNQLYEELSRLNNEVINRERELARKTAALERLSAEKSRMIAIAAHDLRNPLTVISSYAGLLKMEAHLNDQTLLYVDEIDQSARFMDELVEEMLDAAQFESGRVDVDRQDIDLVNAARHAATINRIRADRKQITIAFETRVDRAVIEADPVKLRQIINNLVVNAIKFSRGGTTVTIRVHTDADRAVVEVEDQGIGIPRDKMSTIFEAFKTLGATGTAGEKSTGLGLAIVKEFAHLHRATVDVESEPGKGSIFRVWFPLKR